MFHNKIIAIAVLLVGCALISGSQMDINLKNAEANPASGAPEATVAPVEASTEDIGKKTTTTTTTVAPKTTTPTTSTSSTTSTTSTTTLKPTPTTTPKTTTKMPDTTTPAPDTTTSTSAPITTTPAPAPYPDPEVGTWNSTCVMIRMGAQLNLTYTIEDNNKTMNILHNIPKDAHTGDGDCLNQTQVIQLNWGPDNAKQSFAMYFDKQNNSVVVSSMTFQLTLLNGSLPFVKEERTFTLHHRGKNDFKTPLKMSYHCTRHQMFNFTETVPEEKVIATLNVFNVQLEAFRDKNAKEFSATHDCDSSDTSDVVPIAVGIALVALILIVLISYLCARRNSTSRGYMSF